MNLTGAQFLVFIIITAAAALLLLYRLFYRDPVSSKNISTVPHDPVDAESLAASTRLARRFKALADKHAKLRPANKPALSHAHTLEEQLLPHINKDSLLEYCQRLHHAARQFKLCTDTVFAYRLDKEDKALTVCKRGTLSKIEVTALSIIRDITYGIATEDTATDSTMIKDGIAENSLGTTHAVPLSRRDKERLIMTGINLDLDQHCLLFKDSGNTKDLFMIVAIERSGFHQEETQLNHLYWCFSASFGYHSQRVLHPGAHKPCRTTQNEVETSPPLDLLTGAWSKLSFLSRLNAVFTAESANIPVCSIILFEVDHLATLKSRWGQPCYDRAIQHISALAQEQLGQRDGIARWSQDQFALYLPNVQHFGALQLAERLRLLCQKTPLEFDQHTIPVTITLSVSSFQKQQADFELCLNRSIENARRHGFNHTASA